MARECIHRVCEAAGLITQTKRRPDKKIGHYLAETPCMKLAGTNVTINVSSRELNFVDHESGETLVNHEMPRISFASGGDAVSDFEICTFHLKIINSNIFVGHITFLRIYS